MRDALAIIVAVFLIYAVPLYIVCSRYQEALFEAEGMENPKHGWIPGLNFYTFGICVDKMKGGPIFGTLPTSKILVGVLIGMFIPFISTIFIFANSLISAYLLIKIIVPKYHAGKLVKYVIMYLCAIIPLIGMIPFCMCLTEARKDIIERA